jgi:hypothetical protein
MEFTVDRNGRTRGVGLAESGTVEMNCFLCHFPTPNNAARVEALQAGEFRWANTATLLGTGLVERSGDEWQWNPDAFDADGSLLPDYVTVQDPSDENCGQCHGLVHYDVQTPLVLDECRADQWSTITTGQVFSAQRLADTGLNFEDKPDLSRSRDVHAERVVSCTDCHYALNNPVYYRELDEERPDHLVFDPRRIDLGEYLYRPLHEFAKGQSAQGKLAPEFDNTARRCESCHNADESHDWLPYTERHMAALACETCHIPKLYAPARQTNDWTVVELDGTAQTACRGVEAVDNLSDVPLLSGYEPVLLPRENGSLAPFNLITSWYWVYGDPARPVPLRDLQAAWLDLDGDGYHAEILAGFDANGDGALNDAELVIDTDAKAALIAGRLWSRLGCTTRASPGKCSRTASTTMSPAASGRSRTAIPATRPTRASMRRSAGGECAQRRPAGTRQPLAGGELRSALGQPGHHPENSAPPSICTCSGTTAWLDRWLGRWRSRDAGRGGTRTLRSLGTAQASARSKRSGIHVFCLQRQWHWLQTARPAADLPGLIIHKPDLFGAFSFHRGEITTCWRRSWSSTRRWRPSITLPAARFASFCPGRTAFSTRRSRRLAIT